MAGRRQRTAEQRKQITNVDSYEQLFAGMGGKADKTASVTPGHGLILTDSMLSDVYAMDGIGSRVIKLLAHDMVKNGYMVKGDNEHVIDRELKELKNKKATMEALTWTRTYGGAITVVGVNDGKDLDKPIGKKYDRIQWMKTIARTRIEVREEDLIIDPKDPNFGEYAYYHIQFGKIGGIHQKVHQSRCLVYKGIDSPDDPKWYSNIDIRYWGLSAVQPIWDQLKQLGSSFQGMAHLMMELVIGKYKLKDLATLLSSPNAELVKKRLELINLSKSMINGVVLDAESEDYIRDMVNVSGSDKILEQLMIMLSAASGYPVTILYGRSPDGMNATGASDLSNYDSMVESAQETVLEGPQQKLINIINHYKKVDLGDGEPIINFNPVRTPPVKELVESRKLVAEIDNMYIQSGVLSAEAVQDMRFGERYDLLLMESDMIEPPDPNGNVPEAANREEGDPKEKVDV